MKNLTIQPARLPMNTAIAEQYNIDKNQWRVLTEQIFPNAKSVEAILMAKAYCDARSLDIMKKPVHIVPMWSSEKGLMVETVWPGIAEIRTTATRTGEYVGCDEVIYGPEKTVIFSGNVKERGNWIDKSVEVTFPEWAKMTVYRIIKGNKASFTAKVRWLEAYSKSGKSEIPNSMWLTRVYGQIDKCVEAAALRMAFPEEIGTYTADEMEGKTLIDSSIQSVEVSPVEDKTQMTPPPPPDLESEVVDAEIVGETEPNDDDMSPDELIEQAKVYFSNANTLEDLERIHEVTYLDLDIGGDFDEKLEDLFETRKAEIAAKVLGA